VTAVYGVGTLFALQGVLALPQSSVVPDLLRDAACWPELGAALREVNGPIFALDYSIAAQIWFYADRPAYTAWGQYLVWGLPPLTDVTVVGLDYVPDSLVSERLRDDFDRVDGPEPLSCTAMGVTRDLSVWRAEGRRGDQAAFLRRFDFLTLLENGR
jgi:hypothetical protein